MKLVDWPTAVATASRVAPPGPRVPLDEAVATVEQLRELSATAQGHVAGYTGLSAPDGPAAVVVDRPGWVRANADGFRELVDPLLEQVLAGRRGAAPSPLVTAVGSRVAGAELGLAFAYLSTRVLGQYEMTSGRLLLVAPNIVQAESSLGVDPRDFRLWVCLHEVTHRTQFAAAPWLADHVRSLLGDYLAASDLDPSALLGRLRGALGGLVDSARGRSSLSLVELVQTPEQREILGRVTGLMSLLEGHADVVMDGVGPQVVPSVAVLRERFERRRTAAGPVEAVVRRLLGMDMKLRQYAEGAAFVREVVAAAGMDGLNRVWQGPQWLPDASEIRDPRTWLDRADRAA